MICIGATDIKIQKINFSRMIEITTNIRTQDSTDVISGISGSTLTKMEFICAAIDQRRDIAAFHFNDVFCEFCDIFYKGESFKKPLVNFKKWMQRAADFKRVKVTKARVDHIDRYTFGVRNIWAITYSH